MRHGADVQKAMTAGLLHDCGKYCDVNEQILLCRKHHIKLSDAELEVPALIHARLGAYLQNTNTASQIRRSWMRSPITQPASGHDHD